MGARRRTAQHGFGRFAGLAFAVLLATTSALEHAPVAVAAETAPGASGPAMNHTTATRIGEVDPRRDGVARSGATADKLGSGTSAGRRAGLTARQWPGVAIPKRFDLPHWLPESRATGSSASRDRVSGPGRTAVGSGASVLAFEPGSGSGGSTAPASLTGTGLRSDFGMVGLTDADDSLLYAECSVFELCEEPPDPAVAVSATSVVQSVNELMLIVDRQTNGSRVMANFDFFSLDSNQVMQSDPKVIYDAARHRWLATEISADCGHGYLHMAVSASDDPFGVWTVYRIVFPGLVVDFPGLGMSNDTVVVSLNTFAADPESPFCLAPGEFEGGMLVAVDWSDLVKRVPSLPVTTTEPEPTLFTWRPAMSAGGDPLVRLVVAIDTGSEDTADIGYATLSGTNADRSVALSPVINLTAAKGLAPFATPPQPRQPGNPPTITRAVDGEPTDAISASGHLWFVATAPCSRSGDDAVRACVRVTDLLTGTGPSAVEIGSDTRLSEPGADLFMGGIGRALNGTMFVVYSRSSADDVIADWGTWRALGESGFHQASLLIPGGGVYSGTRWGDYVILAPDPAAPDAVWQSHQAATVDGTWFTWISQIRPAPLGPLEGSFRLNGGDTFAGETYVELQLDNPADVAATVVRVANSPTLKDGVLAGGLTLPMAIDQPWSLEIDQSGGTPPDGEQHVYVQWGDGLGHWSAVASDSIILDTTAPTAGALAPLQIGASSLGAKGGVPVELQWQAGRDATSGIEGYAVEILRDDLEWDDFAAVTGLRASGVVQAGHRYQWRVRSFDRLGNASEWRTGPSVRIDAIDDTSTTVTFDTRWQRTTRAGAYRGGVHATASSGAAATFTFTGTGFALVGTVGSGRGDIAVFVDGVRVGRFAEGAGRARAAAIGFRHRMTRGKHTVRLVATDGRRVDVDAVILLR